MNFLLSQEFSRKKYYLWANIHLLFTPVNTLKLVLSANTVLEAFAPFNTTRASTSFIEVHIYTLTYWELLGIMNSSLATTPRGFRETLKHLNSAQKSGAGVPAYTRWINRRIARVFAAAAVKIGLGPNGVTALSATVSVIAMSLMVTQKPTFILGFFVAVLFALGYALDSADGQVARVTRTSSPAGEWLDHVVDSMRTPAMHLTILVGFLRYQQSFPLNGWQLWWLPLAFSVLVTGHFMSQILAEQLRNNKGTSAPATGGTLRSFVNLHMDAGTFCWIFIFWGMGWGFVAVYGLLFLANLATVALSMRRKFITLSIPAGSK